MFARVHVHVYASAGVRVLVGVAMLGSASLPSASSQTSAYLLLPPLHALQVRADAHLECGMADWGCGMVHCLSCSLPLPLSCTPSSTSGECTGGSTVESTVVGGGVGKNGVGALALGKYGVSARNDTLAALPLELALVHAATGSGD